MNIFIASDSFKDCLSALQVATAIEEGLLQKNPQLHIRKVAIADGGEGSVEVLMQSCSGKLIEVEVCDPLFRLIRSTYALLTDSQTAVIEMAKASGIELLTSEERNPLHTTTYGTGELIRDALDRGCRKFICFIGGSATNDGGMGMARALGVKFYDASMVELKGVGGELMRVNSIVLDTIDPRIAESEFIIACDVTNPLVGSTGATYTYGAQKGADPTMMELLEQGMVNYASHLSEICGETIDTLEGAGAAGGLGAGMVALLQGTLKRGIEIVMNELQLDKQFEWADVVITGEGRMDGQTLCGKAPYEVAKLAKSHGCSVIGVAGVLGANYEALLENGFDKIISLKTEQMSAAYSIAHAERLLKEAGLDLL